MPIEDVGANPGLGAEASAARSEDTDGVRLIHDRRGIMAIAELTEAAEVGGVAIHAEERFGHHPPAASAPGPHEGALDRLHVDMAHHLDSRPRDGIRR